jgi:hypothetical protein
MATGYPGTVRSQWIVAGLPNFENEVFHNARHALAGKTRAHVEYVQLPDAEPQACSSNYEVCWDGRCISSSESVDVLHVQKALDKMNLRLIAWSELKILTRSLPLAL